MENMYLYPEGIMVSSTPITIHTVLGSCISVVLYDAKNNIGGINHYMLPFWNGQGLATPRYGNIAIQKLYEKMLKKGASTNHLIAKVFGGSEVLQKGSEGHFRIGERNAELAVKTLQILKIPVKGQSLGGKYGRKIIFDTGSGVVQMKFLGNNGKS
ncbi:MAG: chemotaxis protein CheD [Cyclobacteriaceae bacterium]|nr:chemotaxis protein CheD [Cyclobacteriaceae bacterium]